MTSNLIHVKRATTEQQISRAKALFQEYAEWLGVDLCFQGFEREMATFPALYETILIGTHEDEIVGTVALKALDAHTCEMKRLYVQPAGQKLGLGKALCLTLIDEAKAAGFTLMKIDSLARLAPAIKLYKALGFIECPAYNHNPESDVVYMELALH